jgi:hypothetical protein
MKPISLVLLGSIIILLLIFAFENYFKLEGFFTNLISSLCFLFLTYFFITFIILPKSQNS